MMNESLTRFLKYMQFKGECMAYQQANPVRLDIERVDRNLQELEELIEEKVEILKKVMPPRPIYKMKQKPKNMHKKDGTLSKKGEEWFGFLKQQKLSPVTKGPVKYQDGEKEPNPGSSDQVKYWLTSLGWEPCTFKYVKEGDSERAIPQVRKEGELTDSVLALVEKEPDVQELADLTVYQHRMGVFKGFASCAIEIDGKHYLEATTHGLTNTLRFKHQKPLVNLPGVDKYKGDEIRGCLIADDGEVMLGSDMVSLESTTKRHYIYPHDPDYADEMSQEGFDEHVDLAVKAGDVSREDYVFYTTSDEDTVEDKERYSKVHKVRKVFKPVNYSAIYGVGVKALMRGTGMGRKKAAELLEAYWERNWAVKKVAEEQATMESHGYNWLFNPVSGFWYELRYDKDRFSTLNQGTGVYIFDSWLARCAANGYMGQMQFHDETAASTKEPAVAIKAMTEAITTLNDELDLNVSMDIDYKTGGNYADVH
jgi:hypothetical protein